MTEALRSDTIIANKNTVVKPESVFCAGSGSRGDSYITEGAGRFLREQDCFPVIIGMERLDEGACGDLADALGLPCARFLSGSTPPYVMAGILHELDLLVTSRYHACVLGMQAGVPAVAVSMDERLDGILKELHMEDEYLFHVADADLGEEIHDALERAFRERSAIAEKMARQVVIYRERLRDMGAFVKGYIADGLKRGSPPNA